MTRPPNRAPTDLSELDAHAAALCGLPGMTPARLVRVLDGFGPIVAFEALAAGTHPADRPRRFEVSARSTDLAAVAERYRSSGVRILWRDGYGYPRRLIGDRGEPAVLFALGDVDGCGERPSVAIVGTRSATPYGRAVAAELGGDLSAAGVAVVSGLATGVDAAAHTGVVRRDGSNGPPIAVVGTGLDVVYPSSHADLWDQVASAGAVLSEAPLGTLPRPRVFPARNRIIAALADVVVVVECHHRGGSLYTAEAAARRGIPVGAVPGSVRSPASSGCNALIADGCFPVRDADDVLAALALARADPVTPMVRGGRAAETTRRLPASSRPKRNGRSGRSSRPLPASLEERRVRDAVDDQPTVLETLLLRTGLSVSAVALACEELVARGELVAGPGWWARAGLGGHR